MKTFLGSLSFESIAQKSLQDHLLLLQYCKSLLNLPTTKKRKENVPYVKVQYDPDEVSHKVPSVY